MRADDEQPVGDVDELVPVVAHQQRSREEQARHPPRAGGERQRPLGVAAVARDDNGARRQRVERAERGFLEQRGDRQRQLDGVPDDRPRNAPERHALPLERPRQRAVAREPAPERAALAPAPPRNPAGVVCREIVGQPAATYAGCLQSGDAGVELRVVHGRRQDVRLDAGRRDGFDQRIDDEVMAWAARDEDDGARRDRGRRPAREANECEQPQPLLAPCSARSARA